MRGLHLGARIGVPRILWDAELSCQLRTGEGVFCLLFVVSNPRALSLGCKCVFGLGMSEGNHLLHVPLVFLTEN